MFAQATHQYKEIRIFHFLSSQEFLPKNYIIECCLKAFSGESNKDFILNILETYQFYKYQLLVMLHKSTINGEIFESSDPI